MVNLFFGILYYQGAFSWGSALLVRFSVLNNLICVFLFIPAIIFSPFFLIFERTRTKASFLLLFSVTYILVAFGGAIFCLEIFESHYERLSERSDPVIKAIKLYDKKYKIPPRDLNDLVTEFLPEYPSPNMGAFSEYHYTASDVQLCETVRKWMLYVYNPGGHKLIYKPSQSCRQPNYGEWIVKGDWAFYGEY